METPERSRVQKSTKGVFALVIPFAIIMGIAVGVWSDGNFSVGGLAAAALLGGLTSVGVLLFFGRKKR